MVVNNIMSKEDPRKGICDTAGSVGDDEVQKSVNGRLIYLLSNHLLNSVFCHCNSLCNIMWIKVFFL